MDEDVSIINSNTRNEKIKNFFKDNKKILLALLFFLLILIISYFSYGEYKGIQTKKFQTVIIQLLLIFLMVQKIKQSKNY